MSIVGNYIVKEIMHSEEMPLLSKDPVHMNCF